MALVTSFREEPHAAGTWRTETACGWRITTHAGRPILHLETYGSGTREIPGKVSQSLQLDEAAARELRSLIDRAFPRPG